MTACDTGPYSTPLISLELCLKPVDFEPDKKNLNKACEAFTTTTTTTKPDAKRELNIKFQDFIFVIPPIPNLKPFSVLIVRISKVSFFAQPPTVHTKFHDFMENTKFTSI